MKLRIAGSIALCLLAAGCGTAREPRPQARTTVVDTIRRYVVVLGDSDRARAGAPGTGETSAAQPGPDSTALPKAKPAVDTSRPITLNPRPAAETTITITGIVQRLDIEGGFWGIMGYDNHNYRPTDLPPGAHHPGAVVRCHVRLRRGPDSDRDWGIPVEVLACEVIRR